MDMNDELQRHLQRVLVFLDEDQWRDCVEQNEPADHIYESIVPLYRWLEGYEPAPEEEGA